jgi:hypothetical protein
MRLHSKCHIGNVLDVSIEKQFNDDLGKVDKKSSDDETDL